jgi:hypothetical protein
VRGTIVWLAGFCSLFFLWDPLVAQVVKSDTTLTEIAQPEHGVHEKAGLFVLPLLYYTPDTRWAAGAFGVYYFRLPDLDSKAPSTRLSYVKLLADYTQNRQLDLWSSWNIFLRNEAFLFKGEARYRIYPDRFYGIGNMTPKSNEERYQYDYIMFKLLAMKKFYSSRFRSPMFFGPDVQYTYSYNLERAPEGQLINGEITGSQGGLNSGVGLVFLLDSRDNVVNASQGIYFEASTYFFTPALGGDFRYNNINIVYNRYFRILKRFEDSDHILATNFVVNLNAGDPPFINLAAVGNDDILRGYPRYRYRDQHYIAGQAEYRFPIWWRFGGVAFAGIGDVFNRPRQVSLNTLKYSYGAGLRFAVNRKERLNIRFDYGFGRDSRSFYISLTEAF